MSRKFKIAAVLAVLMATGSTMAATAAPDIPVADNVKTFPVLDKDGNRLPNYTIPSDTLIAREPNADEINHGKRLLNETRRLLPQYTGANMNCNSCHVQQGKKPLGAPYINTVNSFPQFSARADRVVTLEDRINGCFMRSMNGKPLDKTSSEMKAIIAYMKWLAQAVPHGARVQIENAWPIDTKLVGDPARGKNLYAAQCASCHGLNGEGRKDRAGNIVFPPLWGDESFNIGAGLARTYKAAAFIRNNMPMGVNTHGGWGEGNVLSDQDAVDVAEYFTHMPRPDFPGKEKDWPSGKKPKDARY